MEYLTHHGVELLAAEEFRKGLPVRYVHPDEAESRLRVQLGQPRAFQRHRIIIVEIVYTHHGVPPSEKPP